MKNHKMRHTIAQVLSARRRWHVIALGATILLISFMIGCDEQSPLTNTDRIDAKQLDNSSGAASLFLEPDVQIDSPRHFLVHRILLPPPVQDTVALKGQFEVNHPARRALVRRMHSLLNPAQKIHNGNTFPSVDEDEHLTAYRLRTADEPVRQVWLENQFGQQVWTIGNPLFLYAPAQKQGHAFPDSLDHYKCYEVLNNGGAVDAAVEVSDQFLPSTPTTVREGKLFCVPVRKRHRDQFYPINNPVGHLAVYSIDPITMDALDRMVRDQFDERTITVLGASRLVAESRKVAWQVVD